MLEENATFIFGKENLSAWVASVAKSVITRNFLEREHENVHEIVFVSLGI